MVRASWQRNEDGRIEYSFTIPAGSRAVVRLPGKPPQEYCAGEYRCLVEI